MNGNKSAAYTNKEKMLLAQLVKDNSIVENKQTDGASLSEKNQAWELITVAYNSQSEVNIPRTSGQLRKLWTNLKQRKRKEVTALRHSFLATGGGPPPKAIKIDPVLKLVEDAAPSANVTMNCDWDSIERFEKGQAEAKKMWKEQAAGASLPLSVVVDSDELPVSTPLALVDHLFLPNLSMEPHKSAALTINKKDFGGTMPLVSGSTSTALEPSSSHAVKVSTEEGVKVQTRPHLIGGTLPHVSASTCTAGGSGSSQQQYSVVKLHAERGSRISKITKSIRHEQALQDLRKQILEEDLLSAKESRKAMNRREELAIQTAEFNRQRSMDEAKLAKLKLQYFKKKMLSEDI